MVLENKNKSYNFCYWCLLCVSLYNSYALLFCVLFISGMSLIDQEHFNVLAQLKK